MACIDVVPNTTSQAAEGSDIFNVGGFSDAVFDMIAAFTEGRMGTGHWAEQIDAIAL